MAGFEAIFHGRFWVITDLLAVPARLDAIERQLALVLERLDAETAGAGETITRAARRTGLSPATLRRQVAAGKIRGRRVGRRWIVDLRAGDDNRIAELAREARR